MPDKTNENNWSALKFVLVIIILYGLLYSLNYILTGLIQPGGYYSEWLATNFDYITAFRNFLLGTTGVIVETLGYDINQQGNVLYVKGGQSIRMVYSCIGINILCIWWAFVAAVPMRWMQKIIHLLLGTLVLVSINLIRLCALTLNINAQLGIKTIVDHHILYNFVVYVLIFVVMKKVVDKQLKFFKQKEMNSRSKIKRSPRRAIYDTQEIVDILDRNFMCHVGFIQNGSPIVIPTMYGRYNDDIFIHGASVSRLINELEKGIEVCVSIATTHGLVLARSAFHHSLNYESVVLFGQAKPVNDQDKMMALKVISDHLLKNRWEEVRMPNAKELKATTVLRIKPQEISGKMRTGDPVDDAKDKELDIWSGVLPISKKYAAPIPSSDLKDTIPLPDSIKEYGEKKHVK